MNRRRTQLWILSLLAGCVVPAVVVILADVMPASVRQAVDLRTLRLVMVAMLVAVLGYVARRERALRRLATLSPDEGVLTAPPVDRVHDLDLLLRAGKAMNSGLDLTVVLDVILDAACDLLDASEGSIQVLAGDDPSVLELVAVRRTPTARVGERQLISEGLAGAATLDRSLVVPLEARGELLGVLNLSARDERKPFSEFDLRSVAVFAEAAAAAISNARVHVAAQQRVAALSEADAAKDEMLAGVVHDLRTPLTSMIGLAATIATGSERLPAARIRQLAETVQTQGWRLDRLVGDLLHVCTDDRRAVRVSAEIVDAGEVVGACVDALQAGAADHALTVEAPPVPVIAGIDPGIANRILSNLIGNAVKYTPAGSEIAVRLERDERDVVLRVTDAGPGMPAEHRARAFDKYYRAQDPRRQGGLGLGLYIVRVLAEAHGGGAELREAPRGGLEAVVRLRSLPVDEPSLAVAVGGSAR